MQTAMDSSCETIEPENKLGDLIMKAWEDETFKQRLVENPRVLLEEHGINVPDDVEVVVVENTPKRIHVVLPSEPRYSLCEPDSAGLDFGLIRGAVSVSCWNPLSVKVLVCCHG